MNTKAQFVRLMIGTMAAYIEDVEETETSPFEDPSVQTRINDFMRYLEIQVDDETMCDLGTQGHGELMGFLESKLDRITETDEDALRAGEDFVGALRTLIVALGGKAKADL